jgi:hypothetical protein
MALRGVRAGAAVVVLGCVGGIVSAASAATSISIGVSDSAIAYGQTMRLSGAVAPTGTAEVLTLESNVGGSTWTAVGTVTTDDNTGGWERTVAPGRTTAYRVRTADSSVISSSQTVTVAPRLTLRASRNATPFLGAVVRATVVPARFSGTLLLTVRGGTGTKTVRVWIRRGRAHATVPTNGVGRFAIGGRTLSNSSFAGTRASTSTRARGRTLRQGTSGADVRALLRHLSDIGFHTPGSGGRYTFPASEVTLAFQKAYGLPRTYVWGQREWRLVSTLKHGPSVKFTGAGTHIEVDKGRQILMVVTNGKLVGTIAVSSGATGNTPLGNFSIYQRGGSHLFRFMGFIGNFGIHGYVPVPSFPASHGCVREPMWAASWTWNHSKIGTKVHIYS